MPSIPLLVSTSLVTGLVVSVFYGVFFVLFIASTYFLFLRQVRLARAHNDSELRMRYFLKPAILFNILMFLCVTLVKFSFWLDKVALSQSCRIGSLSLFESIRDSLVKYLPIFIMEILVIRQLLWKLYFWHWPSMSQTRWLWVWD
jgi:hypothetical protein